MSFARSSKKKERTRNYGGEKPKEKIPKIVCEMKLLQQN